MNKNITLTPTEQADANQVDDAIEAMELGSASTALKLLLDVISRCPERYVYSFQEPKGVYFKFWDENEFRHFFAHMKDTGSTDLILSGRTLYWLSSAYPRAFYFLAFINVVLEKFDEAIVYLDRGLALEPTNANLRFEKAVALTHLKRFDEALQLYESVDKVGLHNSPSNVARSFRGRGGILLEMGRIAAAEAMFQESLKFDSTNQMALNELQYIAHLRSGGQSIAAELTVGTPDSASKCSRCGNDLNGESQLITKNGKTVFLCDTCQTAQN